MNKHRQVVVGMMSVLGAIDTIYVLKCDDCGLEHGVHGLEVHDRRCPRHDPGLQVTLH